MVLDEATAQERQDSQELEEAEEPEEDESHDGEDDRHSYSDYGSSRSDYAELEDERHHARGMPQHESVQHGRSMKHKPCSTVRSCEQQQSLG